MSKLGDYVSIKASKKELHGEKFWLLNLDMVEQQTGQVLDYLYVPAAELNGSIVQFDTDCVLYSKLRPNLNKVVLPQTDGYATSEMLPLRPNTAILSREYLAEYLRSDNFVNWAVSKTAGAKMPRLGTKELLGKEITPPPLEEQAKIVALFQEIARLIALNKQQLAELDNLVKSRFIELFGDPETNPMGWEKVNISAVVGGKVTNGFFAKRDDYCASGNVQVLGVANVVNRMYSNVENLPQTNGTDADIKKYGVKYGDMLFCRSSLVAAGIGKASIVSRNTPNNVLFECHVIRLPLDLTKCVPEFMQVLSTTEFFRKQVISQSKTATMTTIGQDGIMKTTIILPPLELQKQFLSFVEHTDKLKLAVSEALAELETLKKSLMQQYFG